MNKIKKEEKFILWFDEITKDDVAIVGGKNANLGELYKNVAAVKSEIFPDEKINIPFGFALTSFAYEYFLKENNLTTQITSLLSNLNTENQKQLEIVGNKIRELIIKASFPKNLEEEIISSYSQLAKRLKISKNLLDVAVRSSATAEDLENASFAGQQESYLNINGEKKLLIAIKKCISSLFTNRAISYRVDKNYLNTKIALSVGVQKMARSDRGSSGVMFTLDTDTGFRDIVLINGSWGLGEFIVKGIVTPDEFMVFKPTLKNGFKTIISKKLGSKKKKLIYDKKKNASTKAVNVEIKDRQKFILNDEQILTLAKWGIIIEKHYQKPMDIEWAYDGIEDKLYIVQARSETVQARRNENVLEEYELLEKGTILTQGAAVGQKIGQGKARFIKNPSQLSEFKKGEILIAEITDPDWEPIMKNASAIVTDAGGRTSHAAIVSRELGIPAIVGTGNATKIIPTGKDITVCCSTGAIGKVYKGILQYKINRTDLQSINFPKTEIKMIIANPNLAFNYSFIPNKGVGLAREEFIISNFIKIHPNALIYFDTIKSQKTKQEINKLTTGYSDKTQYYVDKLASGISILAASFYPHEVLLRFSDFKSNEYANLIGGQEFEPHEENPMLGWRGASRYTDTNFRDAFALECKAVKKVREEMGLTNLQVMIPFCRTPSEGRNVINEMRKNGLTKKNDFKIWVMAEIPSNILQIDEFAEIFDGFSIGSNDLTQLTLGLDRDSKLISHIGNENNPSIYKLIHELITKAHQKRLKVGICGQGPSDFPQFAEFLVKEGIDSISLSPDAILKTIILVNKLEQKN